MPLGETFTWSKYAVEFRCQSPFLKALAHAEILVSRNLVEWVLNVSLREEMRGNHFEQR